MNFSQVTIEAFRSMNANRLRSVLTMLGIVIGITSVVMLLAVGESMKQFINKELEQLGTNMLFILPGGRNAEGKRTRGGAPPALTLSDAASLNELPSLTGAAPALQGSFKLAVGNETSASAVLGVTSAMFRIRNWKFEQGSAFSEADIRSGARMVVIGKHVAEQFFYKLDPLGKLIRIENVAFQVVGVLHGEGKQVDGGDLADMVIVPITTARAHLVRSPFPDNVHYVLAQAKAGQNIKYAIADINDVLRERHRVGLDQPDDFRIENLASFAEVAKGVSAGVGALLGLIGGISLVVGGIGIMNIMLVSVTERTREIGIRMAIGARPRDVLLQFLMEAVAICLVGGIVGIGLALAFAAVITANTEFAVLISSSAVIIACVFSTVVGVFFGFYPARRASRLMPVDCLRYE